MLKRFIKLNQASTWKGILSLLTAFGLFTLTDMQSDAIATAMASVYIALSVFMPDKMGAENEGPKDGGVDGRPPGDTTED